ncbi:rod shape-determining protein RodA [Dissulfurispira thermophila]|uniref:Peptidoglycan glycosyltransferase RodA n=2 Tax=root TaxID=1 RepID=A0A7G1H3Q9_9BACT|nr:rod shape-determining protein RodA [Dissulfurispira thermophila]BCB97445.1 rod shape-determining protein RodA [Dissulfurispira thermophila]
MVKIDRRLIKNFDWITFSLIMSLAIIGIMTIYSATRPPLGSEEHPDFYLKQILWLFISTGVLFVIVSFDYIWFYRLSYPLYGLGILLLLIVLFIGRTSMGAQRWLSIGPISFQPSEFFRIFFILVFSSYLTNMSRNYVDKISIKNLFLFGILPLILLIKQPDLGTAILLMSLFVVLSLSKGISKKIITAIVIISLISIPFLGHIFWEGLKDYQKNRLTAFIDPDVDPAGIGYHINQSKVSIGSGGFFGKGYLKGTQGPLRFLPEKHTDFIFSVFAEEWGFIGSIVLLGIYLVLFLRGLDTAIKAKDEFGRLTALGITCMFFIYFCVNIGMTLGIMPVVGVPLPFMSYGGTALLSNFAAAGILISIRTRRFELFYP